MPGHGRFPALAAAPPRPAATAGTLRTYTWGYGSVVEHLLCMQGVRGSSPLSSTRQNVTRGGPEPGLDHNGSPHRRHSSTPPSSLFSCSAPRAWPPRPRAVDLLRGRDVRMAEDHLSILRRDAERLKQRRRGVPRSCSWIRRSPLSLQMRAIVRSTLRGSIGKPRLEVKTRPCLTTPPRGVPVKCLDSAARHRAPFLLG